MGGKNVAIVLPDADLDAGRALTAAGAMRYAGQKCTATSRVVVATQVEEAFLDELRARGRGAAARAGDRSGVGDRPA